DSARSRAGRATAKCQGTQCATVPNGRQDTLGASEGRAPHLGSAFHTCTVERPLHQCKRHTASILSGEPPVVLRRCNTTGTGRRSAYFEKSTFGACAAPGVCSSKYSRGPLPSTLAVNTCGKRRM